MKRQLSEASCIDRATEAARLASFLRRLWPAGVSARLYLIELPLGGSSLLALETRGTDRKWTRRVQLQVEPNLAAPVADDLGVAIVRGRFDLS